MSVARLQSGGDAWRLSIVVPAFNEREVLPEFHRRLAAVLDTLKVQAEILYINDGSSDDTIRIMHELRAGDARVAVLDLSRNFGKEIAVTAGLDHTNSDAVIVIDEMRAHATADHDRSVDYSSRNCSSWPRWLRGSARSG